MLLLVGVEATALPGAGKHPFDAMLIDRLKLKVKATTLE